ncbi:fungal-specific transcription factor domain-containing protein [Biscogniauxia mediterranea]|nr:fungal-specific transcription factor domain-containing protein [Biscogniauxia mediterranea]
MDNETYQRGRADDDVSSVDSQPSKRFKRGKYVTRACVQCQKRKTKCEGVRPCSQCVTRRTECITETLHFNVLPAEKEVVTAGHKLTSPDGSSESISMADLLDRITRVERQLKAMIPDILSKPSREEVFGTPAQSGQSEDNEYPGPLLSVEENHRQSFVGETSVLYALRQTEVELDEYASRSRSASPLSSTRPLTPKIPTASKVTAETKSQSWLRTILLSYGIVPDKAYYDTFLRVYFDEIYPLYPFVHRPTVRQTYEYLWQRSLLVPADELDKDETRLQVAIVFICLAIGRCTGSSRLDNTDGTHSAGWSLYCVAMYLLRRFLDVTQDYTISLYGLQALTLMVIYLNRLDASEKAEQLLAYAISSAHILGLHRNATYSQMHVFCHEMSTRVWWCLYALDRSISVSTGRPFIIQDINNDARKPLDLTEDWLEQYKSSTATMSELQHEIESKVSVAHTTPIPFLKAKLQHLRAAGDVWNAVYGAGQATRNSPGVYDYLEILLENSRQTVSPFLRYEPSISYEDQFAGREWWQIKQCLFVHMSYTFLKLLVRKPAAPLATRSASSNSSHNGIVDEAMRAQLAYSIMDTFDKIPVAFLNTAFPFIPYVLSATMVLLTSIVRDERFKNHERYRSSVEDTIDKLLLYCQKTWVGGKTVRTISTLHRIARHTLRPLSKKDESKSHDEGSSQVPQRPVQRTSQDSNPNPGARYVSRSPSGFVGDAGWNNAIGCHSASPHLHGQRNNRVPPPTYSVRQNATVSLLATTRSMRPSPPFHLFHNIQQEPAMNLLQPGQELTDPSFLWPSTYDDGTSMEIPGWTMNDLDFEQALNGMATEWNLTN